MREGSRLNAFNGSGMSILNIESYSSISQTRTTAPIATSSRAIRKSLGVVAGVADLILLIQKGGYGALCIEMKDENGSQKPAQKEWQALVEAQGYRYVICRNLEQFQITIQNYLTLK